MAILACTATILVFFIDEHSHCYLSVAQNWSAPLYPVSLTWYMIGQCSVKQWHCHGIGMQGWQLCIATDGQQLVCVHLQKKHLYVVHIKLPLNAIWSLIIHGWNDISLISCAIVTVLEDRKSEPQQRHSALVGWGTRSRPLIHASFLMSRHHVLWGGNIASGRVKSCALAWSASLACGNRKTCAWG